MLEAEVKNEVQDCPENDSVPGGELYIDENADEKEQEYPDSLEKTDYGSLYGSNQYYNRYFNFNVLLQTIMMLLLSEESIYILNKNITKLAHSTLIPVISILHLHIERICIMKYIKEGYIITHCCKYILLF